MSSSRLFLICALCSLLAACGSTLSNYLNPYTYKIDVQQGNVLSQEMVAQLKPGQTREQVRFILGTPLLTDIFHQQRWDYVYSYRNGRTGEVEARRFSVYFDKNNRLEKASGDVDVADFDDLTVPTARTRVVDFGSLPTDGSGTPMPPPEGPGFFRGLMNTMGF
jgi:outer membrane protein assembly factor BamE